MGRKTQDSAGPDQQAQALVAAPMTQESAQVPPRAVHLLCRASQSLAAVQGERHPLHMVLAGQVAQLCANPPREWIAGCQATLTLVAAALELDPHAEAAHRDVMAALEALLAPTQQMG